MKKCQSCGSVLEDEAIYCSKCGQDFGSASLAAAKHLLSGLNRRSSYNDIYFTMKHIIHSFNEEAINRDQIIRDKFEQILLKVQYIDNREISNYFCLLSQAQLELFDTKKDSEILNNFLLAECMAAYMELNPREYKKASDKLFDEYGNLLLRDQIDDFTKLQSSISKLLMTFIAKINR